MDIHFGIGRRDLATGKAVEVLGFLGAETDNLKYIDAFQESFNARHGFASPKDNPKISTENAVDTLARYTGSRPDVLGTFNQQKAALEIALQKEILAKNITTWGSFEKLLEGYGTVSKMYQGKFNECFRIKPHNADKAMRLTGIFFQRDFIQRSTAEKLAIISDKAKVAYLEQMQPRKAPAYVDATLNEWHSTKAREHRYLHAGSKFYKEVYKPASTNTRLHFLNQLERNHHAKPSSYTNHESKQITPTGNRLPRLPVRDMDGIQTRTKMLLRIDDGVYVGAISSTRQKGCGLRPTAERKVRNERDKWNRGKEEGNQPSSVIARVIDEWRERYEQASDKERYQEIRKNLDCVQLLNLLSHSHGLNPDLYQLISAKDGTPRIKSGTRSLTPSDFLTKEMGLSWIEAALILRMVYERQIKSEVTKPRASKTTPLWLWRDFKEERQKATIELSRQLKIFNETAKIRRVALSTKLKEEQKTVLSGLSAGARKSLLALEKFRAATAKAELTAVLKLERQLLRDQFQPVYAKAWRLYLQRCAQAGDVEALAELRRLDNSSRAVGMLLPSISSSGTITIEEKDDLKRSSSITLLILKSMVHVVELNGDVTYLQNGRAILLDVGQRLEVLDPDNELVIAAGLLIAREKFGNQLSLTGNLDFQRRVVAVAVSQGISVRFADPALEEMRLRLIEEKRNALHSKNLLQNQITKSAPIKTNQPIEQVTHGVVVDVVEKQSSEMHIPEQQNKNTEETIQSDVLPVALTLRSSMEIAVDWANTWSSETGVNVVEAKFGDGVVIQVWPDIVLIKMGRVASLYSKPTSLEFQIGDKVIIDKKLQIVLQKKKEISGNER